MQQLSALVPVSARVDGWGAALKAAVASAADAKDRFIRSNLRLVGGGPGTVLVKEPSVASKLSADSDWYDQEVTLADAAGFRVGDGVCLRAKNPHDGGATVNKRTSFLHIETAQTMSEQSQTACAHWHEDNKVFGVGQTPEEGNVEDGAHNTTMDWPYLYVDQYLPTHGDEGKIDIFDLRNQ